MSATSPGQVGAQQLIFPILPNALEINDGFWKLDGKDMPVMENTSHMGIQKSGNNSAQLTVDENIKKSSRAMYSLMGAALHGIEQTNDQIL
jgi:hypothetical protein